MTGNEYQNAALRTADMNYSEHSMIMNGALSRKRPSKAINSTPNTLPRNLVM